MQLIRVANVVCSGGWGENIPRYFCSRVARFCFSSYEWTTVPCLPFPNPFQACVTDKLCSSAAVTATEVWKHQGRKLSEQSCTSALMSFKMSNGANWITFCFHSQKAINYRLKIDGIEKSKSLRLHLCWNGQSRWTAKTVSAVCHTFKLSVDIRLYYCYRCATFGPRRQIRNCFFWMHSGEKG